MDKNKQSTNREKQWAKEQKISKQKENNGQKNKISANRKSSWQKKISPKQKKTIET